MKKQSNKKIKDREKLFKKQIKERGFSDEETWNLDYSLAKIILPRLKRFKKVTNGYPHKETEKSWNKKLDKMIFAFDLIVNRETWNFDKNDNKKVQKGLDLFSKHYLSLWW